MRYGKLTQTAWQRSVRRQLDKRCEEALLGPTPWETCSGLAGADGEAFLWADAHASGNAARTGYYAVLKAAGDLAAKGVRASCVSIRVLFPPGVEEEQLKEVTKGIEDACGRMDIQVTSFQGETSGAVSALTVWAAAAGKARRQGLIWERAGRNRTAVKTPGQEIVFCGYAGLEGMLRILDESKEELGTRFVSSFLRQAQSLSDQLVVPAQILALFGEGEGTPETLPGITAVIQAGSGGILAALWELAETLRTGFEVDMQAIGIRQETVEICEFYRLNPYQISSAGSFLIATEEAQAVIEILEKAGARAGRLGVTKAQNARVITSGEEVRYLDRPAPDELTLWHAGRQDRKL